MSEVIVTPPVYVAIPIVEVGNVLDVSVTTPTPIALTTGDFTFTGIGSVVGTTNQISVSTSGGVATISLPSQIVTPNNLLVSGNLQVDSPSTFNDDVTITSPFALNADVGGDLQGSLPTPTVHRIKNIDIHNTPADLDLFQYRASNNKYHWVTFAEAGVAAATHTHTVAQITDFDPTNPVNPCYFVDDFLNANSESGEVGIAGWNLASSAIVSVQSSKDHPGVIRLRCPSTSTTVGSMTLTPNVSSNNQFAIGDVVEWTIIFKPAQTNTDLDETYGLFDAYTTGIGTAANGVYIRKTTAGTVYTANCESGGSISSLNLFTQDTNWHKVKAVQKATLWEFYVDGSLIGSINTNNPSSTSICTFGILQQPTGTVNRQVDIDFVSVKTGALNR